jgi:hypothetical protein
MVTAKKLPFQKTNAYITIHCVLINTILAQVVWVLIT